MKRQWLSILCLCVWLASGGAATAAEDAEGVLQASRAAYAALNSYSDVGVVTSADFGDLTFETAFQRPDRFSFAFRSGHPFFLLRFVTIEHVVRADGKRVLLATKTTGREPTTEVEPSLSMAVAGATGVSRGAAHVIATLLMPALWGEKSSSRSVLALTAAQLRPDEAVDRVLCRHVTGTTDRGRKLDLWIGASDHLIRRIDSVDSDGETESELHRDLRVDRAIAASVFE